MFRNPIADVLLVLVVVLLFLGPKRLPELGKSLGSGIREFKDGITNRAGHDDAEQLPRAEDSPEPTGANSSAERRS
jgi:sec-independent protein translocase protein TatA